MKLPSLWALSLLATLGQAQESAEALEHKSVRIEWSFGPETFPEPWRKGDIAAKGEPVAPAEVDRALAAVQKALDAYPEALLAVHLKRVRLVGRMEFFGVEYGGTNSLDTVFLAVRAASEGFTDQFIEASLHHEFSSILLRNGQAKFDGAAWSAANPEGFKYGSGGTDAIRSGQASTAYDSQLASEGILAQYSKASQEEDFNLIAEGLFCGGERFWKLVDSHERLARKVRLVIAFYSALDSQFGEAWFRARVPHGSRGDLRAYRR
ncbi:MAG: hypothetical protein KF884_08095 [Fimbriimonadaceae bacterium]|nr:hypothetical protein [Fimbriimonadaceae bacterium]QYK57511.1 MAG: hypothetical protein KF884_08095 [Fimbriimonadaceae bacterium]